MARRPRCADPGRKEDLAPDMLNQLSPRVETATKARTLLNGIAPVVTAMVGVIAEWATGIVSRHVLVYLARVEMVAAQLTPI